jgi:GT2 family glycosyltransferase
MDVVEGKTVCPDAGDTPFQEQVQNLTGGVLWSCNLGIRRDIFEQIGGFDEDFREAGGEDMEFAWRVAHSGILQSFEPRALVVHHARNIGWKQIVRRLLMIRWISLYHLKTKQSPPLEKPAPSVVLWVIGTRTLNLLRTSIKSLKGLLGSGGNRALFDFALNLFSFPFLLPYIVLWELRFRRMLKERSSAPVEKPIPMARGSKIA